MKKEIKTWDEIFEGVDVSIDDLRGGGFAFPSPLSQLFERYFYSQKFFTEKVLPGVTGKRVLCIGGGIDNVGLFLAIHGNAVLSVDISQNAVDKTNLLVRQANMCERMKAVRLDWENDALGGEFDVIVTPWSLHHMALKMSLDRIHDTLCKGGEYMAIEPVCLSKTLTRMHELFPLQLDPLIPIGMERHLSAEDLEAIENRFNRVEVHFFEMFTRYSVSFFLFRLGLRRTVTSIGKMEHALLEKLPFLRVLASNMVIIASK